MGVIGGGVLLLFGYLKDSKLWKVIGGALSLSGIGSIITGIVKYSSLDFKTLFKSKLAKASSEKTSKTSPGTALVSMEDLKKWGDKIKVDEDDFDNLKDPSYKQQLMNIFSGFVRHSKPIFQRPEVELLLLITGSYRLFILLEAAKTFSDFKDGKVKFEKIDPKTGQKTEYSYTDDKKVLFKNACETLEVKEDDTEQKVKKAFRERAMKFHPDRNPGREEEVEPEFKKAALAYEIIREYRGWKSTGD